MSAIVIIAGIVGGVIVAAYLVVRSVLEDAARRTFRAATRDARASDTQRAAVALKSLFPEFAESLNVLGTKTLSYSRRDYLLSEWCYFRMGFGRFGPAGMVNRAQSVIAFGPDANNALEKSNNIMPVRLSPESRFVTC